MTEPASEEHSEPLGLTRPPDDEHDSELPGEHAADDGDAELQQENAATSLDQPSDGSGAR